MQQNELTNIKYAVQEYVETGRVSTNVQHFFDALDNLSKEEWEHLKPVINGLRPEPYSYKYGLVADQLPRITKQSVTIALSASLTTYYFSKNIMLSVLMGTLSGAFAWQCLTELAYKSKIAKRDILENRIDELLLHDRFFKPRQFPTRFKREDPSPSNEIFLELTRNIL